MATLGNNGKIYRSLRWQQELPQQKLMRVRFERFGLSVLLETDSSFLSPDANESAPDSLSHGTHHSNSPPPKSAHKPLYVVTLAAGMARLGHRVMGDNSNSRATTIRIPDRKECLTPDNRECAPSCRLPMDPAPREAANQDMQTKSGSRNSVKQ